MKVTVIIRNIAPFINLQEPVTYRTVTIDLTPEQVEKIRLRHKHEEYSSAILEPEE